MARIICISYDETLLRTRQLLLQQGGHEVESALGPSAALGLCSQSADLVIIGHSIPKEDKLTVIECYRAANPRGSVIALTRGGEERLKEVDAYINPGDPEELLRTVRLTLERQDATYRPKRDRE